MAKGTHTCCLYTCNTHEYTPTHIYTLSHTHSPPQTHILICKHTYSNTLIYTLIYAHTHIHTHICTHTHKFIHSHSGMKLLECSPAFQACLKFPPQLPQITQSPADLAIFPHLNQQPDFINNALRRFISSNRLCSSLL